MAWGDDRAARATNHDVDQVANFERNESVMNRLRPYRPRTMAHGE